MAGLGSATLKVIANTSQAVTQIGGLARLTKNVAKTATVSSVASVKAIASTAAMASKSLRALGNNVNQVGRNLRTTGLNATFAGAAMTKGFVKMMKVGAEFERAMDMVGAKAVLSETSKEFDMLTQSSIKFAEETRFNAVQVAKAMEQITVKGLAETGRLNAAGDAIKDYARIASTTRASLTLASIGDLDPAEAASTLGMIAKTFKLGSDGTKTTEENAAAIMDVVDGIGKVAQNSSGTIPEIGTALSFVGGQASLLEQDLGMITAAIGVMADQAIRGSRAGTGLARVFTRLSDRSNSSVAKGLTTLGLDFDDIDPSKVSLIQILEKIQEAGFGATKSMAALRRRGIDADAIMTTVSNVTEDISPDEAVALFRELALEAGASLDELEDDMTNVASMYQLFGQRGGPAALSLLKNLEKLKQLTSGVKEAQEGNLGASMADQIEDNVIGALLRLSSKIASISNEVFQSVKEPLRELIEWALEQADRVLVFLKSSKQAAQVLGLIFGTLSVGLLAFGISVMVLSGVVLAFAGVIESIGLALTATTLPVVAALVFGVMLLASTISNLVRKFDQVKAALNKMDVIESVTRSFVALKDIIMSFVKESDRLVALVIDELVAAFTMMNNVKTSGFSAALASIADNLSAVHGVMVVLFAQSRSLVHRVVPPLISFISSLLDVAIVEFKGFGEAVSSVFSSIFKEGKGKSKTLLRTLGKSIKFIMRELGTLTKFVVKAVIVLKTLIPTVLLGLTKGITENFGVVRDSLNRFLAAMNTAWKAAVDGSAELRKALGISDELGSSWVERVYNAFRVLGAFFAKMLFPFMANLAESGAIIFDSFTASVKKMIPTLKGVIDSFHNGVAAFVTILEADDPLQEFSNQVTQAIADAMDSIHGTLGDFAKSMGVKFIEGVVNAIKGYSIFDEGARAAFIRDILEVARAADNFFGAQQAGPAQLPGLGAQVPAVGSDDLPDADEVSDAAKALNTRGSAYTHDIHTEGAIGSLLDSNAKEIASVREEIKNATASGEKRILESYLQLLINEDKEQTKAQPKAVKEQSGFLGLLLRVQQMLSDSSEKLAKLAGGAEKGEKEGGQAAAAAAAAAAGEPAPAAAGEPAPAAAAEGEASESTPIIDGLRPDPWQVSVPPWIGEGPEFEDSGLDLLADDPSITVVENAKKAAKRAAEKVGGVAEKVGEVANNTAEKVQKFASNGLKLGNRFRTGRPGKLGANIKQKIGNASARAKHGAAVMEAAIARTRGTLDPRAAKIAELRRKAAEKKEATRRERAAIFSEGGMIAHPLGQREYGTIKARMGKPDSEKQRELRPVPHKEPKYAPLAPLLSNPDAHKIPEGAMERMGEAIDRAKSFILDKTGGNIIPKEEIDAIWQEYMKGRTLGPDFELRPAFLDDMAQGLPSSGVPKTSDDATSSLTGGATEITDNRTLEVTINTSIDEDELTRKLENMFFNASLGAIV